MNWKALRLLLLLILLTAIPVFISNLNDFPLDSDKGLYPLFHWIYSNKIWFLTIFAILPVVVPFYKVATTESKVKQTVREKLLNTLMTDVFDNDKQKIRITIFEETNYLFVLKAFFSLLWAHIKNEKTLHCGFSFPLPFKRYLQVSKRAGTENNKSKTYFYVDEKTQKQCEGIAAALWQVAITSQSGSDSMLIPRDFNSSVLPNINEINLNDEGNWTEQERKDVKTYMDATFIKNVATLRRLFSKARSFYAIILYNEKLLPVAVLVVDSVKDSHFDPEDLKSLRGYVKIFSTTFD